MKRLFVLALFLAGCVNGIGTNKYRIVSDGEEHIVTYHECELHEREVDLEVRCGDAEDGTWINIQSFSKVTEFETIGLANPEVAEEPAENSSENVFGRVVTTLFLLLPGFLVIVPGTRLLFKWSRVIDQENDWRLVWMIRRNELISPRGQRFVMPRYVKSVGQARAHRESDSEY